MVPRRRIWLKLTVLGSILLLLALLAGRLFLFKQVTQAAKLRPSISPQVVLQKGKGDASFAAQQAMQKRYEELLLLHQLHGPDGWTWFTSLPSHRLVVFYGNPLSPVMGPIGRYADDELLARLHAQAQVYANLDPTHPVLTALDYVSPLAQPVPMSDNSWTYRMPADSVEHYINLANNNHVLFFFDMQIGHSPIQKEVNLLQTYLERPGVDLALDPEFDMPPGGIPSQVFGRMRASEINWVIDRLSQLVQTQHLPPKILIIHQFLEQMLPDWQSIKLKPGVQIVDCVDGFGAPEDKMGDYYMFNNVQRIQYPGMKLFYDLDKPLMTPAAVLALHPSPSLVMYQ